MMETRLVHISIKIIKETKSGLIFTAVVKAYASQKMTRLIQSILSSINSFYTSYNYNFIYCMHSPFLLAMDN